MSYVSRVLRFWLLLGLCMFAWAAAAASQANFNRAAPPVAMEVQVDFCLDLRGDMGPADVETCAFQSDGLWRTGPGEAVSARWIRVRVAADERTHQGLVIHVGPYFLSEVRWYRKVGQAWQASESGTLRPHRDTHGVVGGYRFVDLQPSGHPITYLVRVPLLGIPHVRVNVESVAEPSQSQAALQLGVGAQLGALLLMLGFALWGAWSQPGPLYSRLVLYLALLTLGLAGGSGLLVQVGIVTSPALNLPLFFAVVCLRFVAWVWLSQAFLEGATTPAWYGRLCQAMMALGAACAAAVFMGFAAAVQALIVLSTLIFATAQIVVIWRARDLLRPYRQGLLWSHVATQSLLVMAIWASVYPLVVEDLATHLVRLLDFVTPLTFLAVISLKHRLERLELASVKARLAEADLKARLERQALQERKMLVDMLAHELKTPLASVSLAVGSLQQHFQASEPLTPQRRLHNVQRSVQSMNAIIDRCTLMNRVEDQALKVCRSGFNLAELVQEIFASRQLDEQVQWQVCEGTDVVSDRQLLRVVIDNLLDNAQKYSVPGTPIQVTIKRSGSGSHAPLSLQVSNQVDAARMPDPAQLGSKFYRHELQHETSGSGLGLYLVRQICEHVGIELKHRLGLNSVTFEVVCTHEPN